MKGNVWLAAVFVAVFALSRIPGLLPGNFSAAYALVFCCGVYFRGHLGWGLPLVTMLVTDIALNCYYASHGVSVWDSANLESQVFNYAAYAVLFFLGRGFRPKSSFLGLLGGGILGSILFYFITNTAAWFFNPFHYQEYTRDLSGWLVALVIGIKGFPPTWAFLIKTLLGGGLFTALFAAAQKLTAESPAEKNAGMREPEAESEDEAEAEPAGEPKEAGA